jgi:hypothetical protein
MTPARLLVPLATFTFAAANASACPGVSDGVLCLPLPRGWSSFVERGVTSRRPAAYLLAGNFRFRLRGHPEALPSIPPRRVLISIGDFPLAAASAGWRHVSRLALPLAQGGRRAVAWHVRFAGRAVSVWVRFGTTPTVQIRSLVNARLAAVRRVPR